MKIRNTHNSLFLISIASYGLRVFVLFGVFVFVRAILSWCPKPCHVYIVYHILSTSLQFILSKTEQHKTRRTPSYDVQETCFTLRSSDI